MREERRVPRVDRRLGGALGSARRRAPALRQTGLEGFGESGAVEVFADEDESVLAMLSVSTKPHFWPWN